MTNTTTHGQVPEALRIADEFRECLEWDTIPSIIDIEDAADELRRLHAENEALRTTPVQNPAEIEHVAGDVSKNGAEVNMSTQQTAPATQKLKEQICISDTNQSAACAVGSVGTTSDAQTTRSTHDAPATQQPEGDVVAYLDVGANGYLDLGSELSEDALQQLPKGRHALVIAGTYGIDGYVAAPQPSPTAQSADSVQKDASRYRWLIDQHWIQTEVDWRLISTHQDSTIRQLDAAIDAALAAQGGKDA